jgi:putative membrane protein
VTEEADPRVFFAAERTLLAWVRTALTVMGLGFVVARFGLFLRLLRHEGDARPQLTSTLIGVGLVLLGAAALALAARQHIVFCRGLRPGERPASHAIAWSVWFAFVLAIIGALLGGYLLIGSANG